MNEQEYEQGVRDCANGVEHKAGKSEWYDLGYSSQYALEQVSANGY